MTAVMVVINLFFNNNGETVLFYINTNRITAESIGYGIASAILLVASDNLVFLHLMCYHIG